LKACIPRPAHTPGLALLFALLLLPGAQPRADIYRCVVDGKVLFTDRPCDGARTVELGRTNTLQGVEAREPSDITSTAAYSSNRWYEDLEGYNSARRIARRHNAPLIVYFRTDWCGFCRAVDNELLAQDAAQRVIRPFVKVTVNPEHGAGEKSLFKKMGGTGYPTFLVTTADGNTRRVAVTPYKSENSSRKTITVAQFEDRLRPYLPAPPEQVEHTPDG